LHPICEKVEVTSWGGGGEKKNLKKKKKKNSMRNENIQMWVGEIVVGIRAIAKNNEI